MRLGVSTLKRLAHDNCDFSASDRQISNATWAVCARALRVLGRGGGGHQITVNQIHGCFRVRNQLGLRIVSVAVRVADHFVVAQVA